MVKNIGYWSTRALISALGALGLCAIYYFGIAARPPVTWHESAVSPTTVEPGGTIYVTRRFTVHRDVVVNVTRTLLQGNCADQCMQYDLPESTFINTQGEYNRTLPHVIPMHVQCGDYELRFELHWQNAIGYKYAIRHPPLNLTVKC